MKQDVDEAIVQFIDGHMEGEERSAFQAMMEQDPVLAGRVAAHRWMTQQIVAAIGPPPENSVDQDLLARLGLADDNVIALSDFRKPVARGRATMAVRLGAVAASLVIGVMIGQTMLTPQTAVIAEPGEKLTASGMLADSLTNQLANQQGSIRIGVSFRTESGICRTFHVSPGTSGLGCREGGRWRIPILVTDEADPNQATEYRRAGGDIAPSVMSEVDRRIVGEPLTPTQEAQLRSKGWQDEQHAEQ